MSNINDKAPTGATHRYEHANNVDWYCQAEQGLYRWQQGSWCASVHKSIEDLANSCPLGRLEAIPAERAQPAEDDLTWLARNLPRWIALPGATHIARDNLAGHVFGFFSHEPQPSAARYWFTKDQWLARRAELQNKPSWVDAPEWVTHMAQCDNGRWLFLRCGELGTVTWKANKILGPAGPLGEVLGDWRDTLERRPESVPESPVDIAMGIIGYIDWSTAPAGATHHIGGDQLECPWHQNFSHIRYWNGERWVKRSAFRTLDEAVAKGFAVVARPADLSDVASSAASVAAATDRLTEATQNVLAAVPALMDEKYSFEPEFNPVTVTNETVQLEQPVAVAGTGMPIAEWAERMRQSDIERKSQEAADLALKVSSLLRENPGLFSANELADLHQLCDAELTKRDAAVCGGQKYIEAHWFERGELPPVGVECQAKLWDRDWATMTIKGYHENTVWAGTNLCSLDKAEFRPIRTERDVLLSVIVEEMNHYDTDGKLADAILAAGFKRGEA
ncbi:hypothetical protein D3C77_04220 [compost metagenome]